MLSLPSTRDAGEYRNLLLVVYDNKRTSQSIIIIPYLRYLCGLDAVLFFLPFSLLDARIQDKVFALLAGNRTTVLNYSNCSLIKEERKFFLMISRRSSIRRIFKLYHIRYRYKFIQQSVNLTTIDTVFLLP